VTDRRPPVLLLVCVLVVLEAAAFVGLGSAWAVDLVRGTAQLPGATAFLALFGLGIGLLLGLAARALWRGRRWARSLVMMWQILLVVLSLGWLGTGVSVWGVVVLVVSVAIAIGLLLPAVVRVTTGRQGAAEDDVDGAAR
jgi:hypothetical protein